MLFAYADCLLVSYLLLVKKQPSCLRAVPFKKNNVVSSVLVTIPGETILAGTPSFDALMVFVVFFTVLMMRWADGELPCWVCQAGSVLSP